MYIYIYIYLDKSLSLYIYIHIYVCICIYIYMFGIYIHTWQNTVGSLIELFFQQNTFTSHWHVASKSRLSPSQATFSPDPPSRDLSFWGGGGAAEPLLIYNGNHNNNDNENANNDLIIIMIIVATVKRWCVIITSISITFRIRVSRPSRPHPSRPPRGAERRGYIKLQSLNYNTTTTQPWNTATLTSTNTHTHTLCVTSTCYVLAQMC